jgi:hypothetical protein
VNPLNGGAPPLDLYDARRAVEGRQRELNYHPGLVQATHKVADPRLASGAQTSRAGLAGRPLRRKFRGGGARNDLAGGRGNSARPQSPPPNGLPVGGALLLDIVHGRRGGSRPRAARICASLVLCESRLRAARCSRTGVPLAVNPEERPSRETLPVSTGAPPWARLYGISAEREMNPHTPRQKPCMGFFSSFLRHAVRGGGWTALVSISHGL